MLKNKDVLTKIKFISFCVALILGFVNCKKFVEINPPSNTLQNPAVFGNDATATNAITGIYERMAESIRFAGGGERSITALSGLSADEFKIYSSDAGYQEFANNSLSVTNSWISANWNEAYQYIYTTNVILEGLNNTTSLSDSVKKQLLGEAKFIRAFCNFYLTNLFGDVPLNITSDYQVNSTSVRAPSAQVYDQIVADLQDAIGHLSSDYSFSNGEKIRPNKWAATALLARVYLYQQKWDSAETASSTVINSNLYDLPSDLSTVFLKNSTEAIWQLLPVQPGQNTNEGSLFILTSPPSFVALSDFLMNAFETGDNRMHWVGTFTNSPDTWYYPYKYKIKMGSDLSEYSMVMRLAEQYLIRAEARANQNNISGSQSDINMIRSRAGLVGTTANDQPSLLTAILHERQIELFSEWGHRWFDLKRSGQATTVLSANKGITVSSSALLYPIPSQEIQNNSKITQNPGY